LLWYFRVIWRGMHRAGGWNRGVKHRLFPIF
jgi:hypothetical protein